MFKLANSSAISKPETIGFTRKQVAAMFQCSERHIDELRRQGRLKSFPVGRLIRFTRAEIDRFVADATPEAPAAQEAAA
jgi:excisionase family DNA binding protein